LSKLLQNFHRENRTSKTWAASVILEKLPEVNTSPKKLNFAQSGRPDIDTNKAD
jgi:hypothetical protein